MLAVDVIDPQAVIALGGGGSLPGHGRTEGLDGLSASSDW